MLVAYLIVVSLLGVAALLLARSRAGASERGRERLARELSELREWLRYELSNLHGLVEAERERAERNDARIAELSAAQAEARRELDAARERHETQRSDARLSDDSSPQQDDSTSGVGADASSETASSEERATEETAEEVNDVYAAARRLDDFFNATTHPRELLHNETFERGVALSRGEPTLVLLARAAEYDAVVACMSLEALARREGEDEVIREAILRDINSYYYWPRLFTLRALGAHAGSGPVIARLVARLNSSWCDPLPVQVLREFVASRVAAGETVAPQQLLDEINSLGLSPEQTTDITHTLNELGDALPAALSRELSMWQGARATVEFLKKLGRVWEPDAGDEVFVLDSVAARVAELESAITREPARSVLLVGDSGTGKTALLRALAERLRGENWIVFEAGAGEVLAGQTYIGQLEERVQQIVKHVGGRRVLWVVPNFHETLYAGRHRYSPVGVLDLLLPSIESGAVRIIGEVPSEAYEQLLRLRPKLRTAMQTCRLAPLSDEETLELGRRWAAKRGIRKYAWEGLHEGVDTSYFVPRASEQTLREALQLAKQYLGDKAAPGNLLLFLDATDRRLSAEEKGDGEITLDDLLVTLSQLTGLPTSILDEREGLDLSELRTFFERRVLGQPEAVDCLVERAAMIKAGLTDPTRPQGVFLFVGPTGTGKTEIAKTLAEFLF
ncbi:MAG: hypothetical protein DMF65_02860, partial [Acidobacteria bacterium]